MDPVRLTVLGSGTSTPSGKRASSGYWLEGGGARMRLDCGAGTVHAMARWGLPWEDLTHQVVSHFHVDHVAELPALLAALKYGRSRPRHDPLALVGPVGLRAFLDGAARLFRQGFLEQTFPLDVRELRPGDALAAGELVLRVAKTIHTDDSLAMRIEHAGRALGYTGDTAPDPALASFFAGVDLLIAECTFLDDPQGLLHLTADGVAELAAASGARRLLVTHCSFDPSVLPERIARRYGGDIVIAEDGMSLEM